MITDNKRHLQKEIGGSDAPIICGVSPFSDPYKLYYTKLGKIEPDDFEKECIRFGNLLEPVIAAAFEEDSGMKTIVRPEPFVHPKYKWMLANIDREIEDQGDGFGPGILECKNTSEYQRSNWRGEPPTYAAIQAIHYMAVTGYKWAIVAGLIGGNHLEWFRIDRNDEAIKSLIQLEYDFYKNHVLAEVPPMGTPPLETINKIYARSDPGLGDKAIEPTHLPAISDHVVGYMQAKLAIEALKQTLSEHERKIKEFMQDTERGYYVNGSVQIDVLWKSQKDSTITDSKLLKAKYPKIWEECQKPRKGSRPFKVTLKNGELKKLTDTDCLSVIRKLVKGE
jgi:putative phage-type endonuclease